MENKTFSESSSSCASVSDAETISTSFTSSSFSSQNNALNPRHPLFNQHGDWFDLGLVRESYHSRLQGQIVAAQSIHVDKITPLAEFLPAFVVKAGEFVHRAEPGAQLRSPKEVAYLVESSCGTVFDLKPSWIGLVNHAPPGIANMYTHGSILTPYANQILRKGSPLTWDYGLEYWIYQVTGLDYNNWTASDIAVFTQMHARVVDYTALLKKKLWRMIHRPEIVKAIQEYLDSFAILNENDNFIHFNTPKNKVWIAQRKEKQQQKDEEALKKKELKRAIASERKSTKQSESKIKPSNKIKANIKAKQNRNDIFSLPRKHAPIVHFSCPQRTNFIQPSDSLDVALAKQTLNQYFVENNYRLALQNQQRQQFHQQQQQFLSSFYSSLYNNA
jgi:hypothetical protein